MGDRFQESRHVGALKCTNELGGEGVTRATLFPEKNRVKQKKRKQ